MSIVEENIQKGVVVIKGARVHNLKNIDVLIPQNKFVVVTGVSGSGKSSLAFDTIYAEGQRRYVESLSSYARQFLGKMHKPDVDYIHGISPAIAIEQKVISRSSRSTVGTSTEIYDYLKLLFARIGKTYSPVSGKIVKRDTVTDVLDFILQLKNDTQVTLLAPVKSNKNLAEQLELLRKQGFSRIQLEGEITRIDELLATISIQKKSKKISIAKNILLVVDRIIIQKADDESSSRIADSVQTAFYEGNGECSLEVRNSDEKIALHSFSSRFEADGITFEDPSIHLFSFNNPLGACKTCEGFGNVIGLDENLIIPNPNLSVFDDAVACWRGEKMSAWKDKLVQNATLFDFPIHRSYNKLSTREKTLLWEGNEYFGGINEFFKHVEGESYKIQYRVMLSRYRGKTLCPECQGTRLRKESTYVKVADKSISEFVTMQVKDLHSFFKTIVLDKQDQQIGKRLLIEIINRLQYLEDVGLGYLTLNRLSNTLSGGESQRIYLSTSLGSSLVGSMYILDEPSIGLHPRDTQQLIKVLKSLRDLGNTVIVVEHDEEIMLAADEIIDLGPGAGTHGGEIVFQGQISNGNLVTRNKKSFTLDYLTGKEKIEIPDKRRKWKNYIEVKGARENNLKNINVKFPLNIFTVVTGVSGSGKTSLIKKILYAGLKRVLGGHSETTGNFDEITGDISKISSVEIVDQNPIGKSSRSNPVTYIKAYDDIRNLFALQPLAKMRYYKPSTFSFNVDGGRCETCEGEGEVTIEMQFMADVYLECETCKGKRFKDDVLEVLYKDKSIADVLDMTIDDAVDFFKPIKPYSFKEESGVLSAAGKLEELITSKLKLLQDVGMGYIKLGQSSSTLSGGEAQRVKLASFLANSNQSAITGGHRFFIFDEPTTGLHFHDIKKLLYALNRLVDEGHTLVVIEHNPDVIKCADHVIDLGPDGGDAGGELVFEGNPNDLMKCKESLTGKFLKKKENS